jgi:hypothetical protein
MARIDRRRLLKLSGSGALAASSGSLATILASSRAPAYAQGTELHWCQRRREDASADRSKNASRRAASRVQLSSSIDKSLLSRPDLECNGRGAQLRGWEARSHAQQREHGEHRTFPAVSTVAG